MSVIRESSRPKPGFRPVSRQQSVSTRSGDSNQRNALHDLPISELIRRNFCLKRTKPTLEEKDETGANDEIVGDANAEGGTNSVDYINPFQGCDEALIEDGMEVTNQYQKAEFNEPAPRRFGSRVRKTTPKWKEAETDLFYKVLSMCGTDFSMISKFFPDRTRHMIVNKFHCEEVHNPERIADALKHAKPLDLSLYATIVGIDEGKMIEDYQRNLHKLSDHGAAAPVIKQKVQSEDNHVEMEQKNEPNPNLELDGNNDEIDSDTGDAQF